VKGTPFALKGWPFILNRMSFIDVGTPFMRKAFA
jgi:hypothetical protein